MRIPLEKERTLIKKIKCLRLHADYLQLAIFTNSLSRLIYIHRINFQPLIRHKLYS